MNTNSVEHCNSENPLQEATAPLCHGVLKIYEPELKKVQSQLKELTAKGLQLQDQIHEENLRMAEMQFSNRMHKMFNMIEVYHAKLVNIKKDMRHLHEKSIKLKKRALKIQQVKEKQDYLMQQAVPRGNQK